MSFQAAAYGLWVCFLAAWNLAALWTGKAAVRAPAPQRLAYLAAYAVGFGLLFLSPRIGAAPSGHPLLDAARTRLWWDPAPLGWALVAVEAASFAFAWWARLHLGRLWSGMMTLREGHRVVQSGPYRLVRHPVYTGFIAAAAALALIVPTPAVIAGAAIVALIMVVKARAEERFLVRELQGAGYGAYAARTPMLVPFLGRRIGPPMRR